MATLLDIVKKGSTDRSVCLRIINSTTGVPETGVVYNTSGIDLWYRREGAAVTSITEATLAALTTAHADGGFLAVGNGEYRLDLPDAALATGANYVDIGGTVTGMIVIGGRVKLVNYDPEDTVRLGLTALPNAAADAAGGLPISDAGGLDLDARLDAAISSRQVAIWAAANSTVNLSATTVNLVNTVTTYTGNTPQTGDSYALANGASGFVAIKGQTAAIETDTQDLQSRTPAALVSGRMDSTIDGTGMENGAVDAILNRDASGSTTNGTLGAIINDLENGGRTDLLIDAILEDTGTTLDGLIDAIKAKTDNLPSDPADQSALEAAITVVGNYVDTEVGAIKTVVDAIKVITDALTAAAAAKLALSAGTIVAGTVDNTGHSPTATEFEADDITEATADHYNGRIIIFTSGALLYQATSISDYSLASGRGHFTVVALTEAPGNNDTFIVV